MSMVNVLDTEELMQCPYDATHRVKAIRYTRHIVKCQRNTSSNLVPCPFNHQHRIPVEDRAKHMISCPDKVVVERDVFRSADAGGDCRTPLSAPTIPVLPEEDWDAACSPGVGPAYNPYMRMNNNQFQNPSILSSLKPADKRAFRKTLQTRGFGDDDEENLDESTDVVPILGLKKLVFPDEDVKGFHPRPSPRKSVEDRKPMASNMSQPSNVTSERYTVTSGPSSVSLGAMSFTTGPRSYTTDSESCADDPPSYANGSRSYVNGPRSYSNGPQSYSNGPRSYANGPRSYSNGPRSYANGPGNYTNGPGNYTNGPGNYTNGPRNYANGPESCTSESSLHDSSFISNVSSVGRRSEVWGGSVRSEAWGGSVCSEAWGGSVRSEIPSVSSENTAPSVRSSGSSVGFSLRGRGRGLRFEKRLSDKN